MKTFPFPDRADAIEELKQDILYHKIPGQDRERVCDMAWERGVQTAGEINKKYPGKRIREIAELEGVRVSISPREEVNGAFRTFGEYYAALNSMTLYTGSIKKWAKANEISMEEAEELVMAHEFFHFMEQSKNEETSRMYQIPSLKIGKLVLVQSGIRALSEIGAHGFARTYYETHARKI